jgi:hypothetical protein
MHRSEKIHALVTQSLPRGMTVTYLSNKLYSDRELSDLYDQRYHANVGPDAPADAFDQWMRAFWAESRNNADFANMPTWFVEGPPFPSPGDVPSFEFTVRYVVRAGEPPD